MELDDCHILFLFGARLNEHVRNIDNCNVPILLGIYDACQKYGIYGDSRRDSILLGNVRALFIAHIHSLALDFSVSLLLEKYVGLQNHLVFFVSKFTPVHGNESMT